MAAPALQVRFGADGPQEPLLVSPQKGSLGQFGTRQPLDGEVLPLAVPRRGHVLSTMAESFGSGIREAVAALTASVARAPDADTASALQALRTAAHCTPDVYRSDAEMVSWLIVSMWVVGVATKSIPVSASLVQAGQWFFGGDAADKLIALPTNHAQISAEKALRTEAASPAYLELLPYILDTHGPGSRLSVMRDPSTLAARSRRRQEGVFYTPADVANYMVAACLDSLKPDAPPTIFDPACGTGVFLRAGLSGLRREYPGRKAFSLASECLYGTDIDPWALDATAFVLLADVWSGATSGAAAPAAIWQRLRRNLVCIDALQIDPVKIKSPNVDRNRSDDGRTSISRLFPSLKRGPKLIIGNPPYTDLGVRSDLASLKGVYQTVAVKAQPSAEIYLTFVEQMIQLGASDMCAGALVLPLSIACNVGPQFTAARKLIGQTPGQWRFAFFDREPHALFGEDVKTRNAIVLWLRTARDTNTLLSTGPLRKWRGDSRAAMFKSLRFTPIDADVRAGIPKIEGEREARALKILSARWNRLEEAVQVIGRRSLALSANADEQTVFIGPTAYNFLNVFPRPPRGLLGEKLVLSEHPLHAITCGSRQDALAIFALLSSHLAYWWWHAHGDGFHVTSRFLSTFPFGVNAMTGPCGEMLSSFGEELWSKINTSPIVSLNRGRTSLAFTPNGHDLIRRKIDQVLADVAGLDTTFVDELQQFTAHTVAAMLRVKTQESDQQEKV
jgi:hypothetical protein